MIFGNKSIIGLEVDSREMRAVELKGSAKNPSVLAWGNIKLPPNAIKDGRIVDPKLFASNLTRLLSENGFKSKEIFLGVNNQDIIMRFATFPKVPDDKIRGMIRFQAQEHIPVPMDELELDFVVVGEKNTDEGSFINVVLVGARQKMLNDFIEGLKTARVTITEIDSAMLALGRAAIISSEEGTFALVGFNNDIGNVLIFNKGSLGMARTISISQSPAWLEYIKDGRKTIEEESNIVSDILLNDVRSSVNYFRMQTGEVITKLYVLGSNSKQEFVSRRLAEATGLTVTIPSPYTYLEKHVRVKKAHGFKSSDYTACISLALRGLEEEKHV